MKNFTTLCIKDITGNIDQSERMLLNEWLIKSDENKKEYEKIKTIWSNSLPSEIPQIPDIDVEWERLSDRINRENLKLNAGTSAGKLFNYFQSIFNNNMKPVLGSAVVVLLLLTFLLFLNKNNKPTIVKTISTVNKEQRQIELPDGSIVNLNNTSSIQFPESFNNEVREVKLNGEAFFSVVKNPQPFVVVTGNAKTTVLGTKFNVWTRGEETRVIVKEGRVNLSSKKNNANGVLLSKDQLSVIIKNQNPAKPEFVNSNDMLGWMSGKLVFRQASLGEVVDELERFYDVPIILEDDALKNLTITGSFQNNDVDSVLTMICLTTDLDFVKQETLPDKQLGGYLIKLKN